MVIFNHIDLMEDSEAYDQINMYQFFHKGDEW